MKNNLFWLVMIVVMVGFAGTGYSSNCKIEKQGSQGGQVLQTTNHDVRSYAQCEELAMVDGENNEFLLEQEYCFKVLTGSQCYTTPISIRYEFIEKVEVDPRKSGGSFALQDVAKICKYTKAMYLADQDPLCKSVEGEIELFSGTALGL